MLKYPSVQKSHFCFTINLSVVLQCRAKGAPMPAENSAVCSGSTSSVLPVAMYLIQAQREAQRGLSLTAVPPQLAPVKLEKWFYTASLNSSPFVCHLILLVTTEIYWPEVVMKSWGHYVFVFVCTFVRSSIRPSLCKAIQSLWMWYLRNASRELSSWNDELIRIWWP